MRAITENRFQLVEWHYMGVLFNPVPNKPCMVFTCLQFKPFENTVGEGEIASNEKFLLFPLCFLPVWITFLPFSSNLEMSSANPFSLEGSKICCLGKG